MAGHAARHRDARMGQRKNQMLTDGGRQRRGRQRSHRVRSGTVVMLLLLLLLLMMVERRCERCKRRRCATGYLLVVVMMHGSDGCCCGRGRCSLRLVMVWWIGCGPLLGDGAGEWRRGRGGVWQEGRIGTRRRLVAAVRNVDANAVLVLCVLQ